MVKWRCVVCVWSVMDDDGVCGWLSRQGGQRGCGTLAVCEQQQQGREEGLKVGWEVLASTQ